jgi:hypothetical protein
MMATSPNCKRYHKKKPIIAFTGNANRTETLPYVNISQIENHSLTPQPLILTSEDRKQERIDMFINESENRKCVYTYEDKYGFSRILTSDSLVFDSHFESGNLHSAFRVLNNASSKNQVYDLYLHSDVNSIGHTQWFYFSVSNVRQGQEVTFVIRNFSKPESLYNDGMRPLIYSSKSKRGWERCGTNICYFNSQNKVSEQSKHLIDQNIGDSKKKASSSSYILCFTHTFEFSSDVCFFSYCHPYTYTDLQQYLNSICSNRTFSKYLRRTVMCKTLAGNNCDLLTITAPAKIPNELNDRITIVLTARVHPGESNASWIIEGLIDYLLQDHDEAQLLRTLYIFKIVPMLNPDGVINGNYRTSLAGCDLNRKWLNPDPQLHPTIYHTKELIRRLRKYRIVGTVLDIHGHSQKQGIFVYGCMPDRRLIKAGSPCIREAPKMFSRQNSSSSVVVGTDEAPLSNKSDEEKLPGITEVFEEFDDARLAFATTKSHLPSQYSTNRDVLQWRVNLLPRVFGASLPHFALDSCSFRMHRAKANTMRMIAFTELGVDCVYTIEASLAGRNPYHFGVHELLQMGRDIAISILSSYASLAPNTSRFYEEAMAYKLKEDSDLVKNTTVSTEKIMQIINMFNLMMPQHRLRMLSFSRVNNDIIRLIDEMVAWRKYYDPRHSMGMHLISEVGMHELYGDFGTEEANVDHEQILISSIKPTANDEIVSNDIKEETKRKSVVSQRATLINLKKGGTIKQSTDAVTIIVDAKQTVPSKPGDNLLPKEVVASDGASNESNVKIDTSIKKKKKKILMKNENSFFAPTTASNAKKSERIRRGSSGSIHVLSEATSQAWVNPNTTSHLPRVEEVVVKSDPKSIPSAKQLLEADHGDDVLILASKKSQLSLGKFAHKLLHKPAEDSVPAVGRMVSQSSTSKIIAKSSAATKDDLTPSPRLSSKRLEKSETSLRLASDMSSRGSPLRSAREASFSNILDHDKQPIVKSLQPKVVRKKSPTAKKQSKSVGKEKSSSKLSLVKLVLNALTPKQSEKLPR